MALLKTDETAHGLSVVWSTQHISIDRSLYLPPSLSLPPSMCVQELQMSMPIAIV